MIKSYENFIKETETVKTDKELREYTLTHMNDDFFQLRSKDFFKEFNVTPYKKEVLEKLKDAYDNLVEAVESEKVERLYSAVTKAELLDFNYGKVFQTKFSLVNIPELDANLSNEQKNTLATSEKDFLLNDFSQLPTKTKNEIIRQLSDRAEVLCCVIEALFYYVRKIDKDNYYDGLSRDEVIEAYDEVIEKASKDEHFSFEGPFSDIVTRAEIDQDSEKAYWICEKDLKKFAIMATISTKNLYSEEEIGGTKGLKFSLILVDSKTTEKDFSYFSIDELPKRIKLFYDKILKKQK